MKKIVSLLLVAVMLLCASAFAEVAKEDLKVGLILLHDENSGYDANFINGMKTALTNLDMDPETQLIIKSNIPEDQSAYDAAVDLAESGCQYIFADSFGHEDFIMLAAEEYPEIQFSHATGYQAASSGLDNMHNAFASIYEGRFAAGVAAGMKLNEMIAEGKITEDQAKVGYVGAYPYAEVVSGYTSYYLGMRYVCPSVTMVVKYTNDWGNLALEKEAATALIAQGCVLMSQHADSNGAPSACEEAGIPNVGYNISFVGPYPNTALISSRIDWAPYMTYAIEKVMAGEPFEADWCKGFNDGAVALTELNEAIAAEGTAEKLEEVIGLLKSGELHVFDASTFTVNGEAPVDDNIYDGYFHESEKASAPCFELRIDGIEELG